MTTSKYLSFLYLDKNNNNNTGAEIVYWFRNTLTVNPTHEYFNYSVFIATEFLLFYRFIYITFLDEFCREEFFLFSLSWFNSRVFFFGSFYVVLRLKCLTFLIFVLMDWKFLFKVLYIYQKIRSFDFMVTPIKYFLYLIYFF